MGTLLFPLSFGQSIQYSVSIFFFLYGSLSMLCPFRQCRYQRTPNIVSKQLMYSNLWGKRAPSGEVDGKLRIDVYARVQYILVYICVRAVCS